MVFINLDVIKIDYVLSVSADLPLRTKLLQKMQVKSPIPTPAFGVNDRPALVLSKIA